MTDWLLQQMATDRDLEPVDSERVGLLQSAVDDAPPIRTGPTRLAIAIVVVAYFIVSIALVLVNKELLLPDRSIPAPIFVVWFQSVFTVILTWLLGELATGRPDIEWLKEFPRQTVDWNVACQMVPVSVSFVLMIIFNQLCLQFVEVSFYNVARSLSIVTNVILSYLILGQKTSVATMLCLLVVILGFFVGTEGEVNLNVLGTLFGVIASVFVSMHSVYTKKSNGFVGGDKWKLAFYSNFIASFMYPPLLVIAGEHLIVAEHGTMFAQPFYWATMFIGSFLGFLIGIVTVMQINFTSPLTHNISGMAKACVQTLLALVIYRNPTTPMAMIGVGLVIGGSGLYTWVRIREDDAAKALKVAPKVMMAMPTAPVTAKSRAPSSYGLRVFLLSMTFTIAAAFIRDSVWSPVPISLNPMFENATAVAWNETTTENITVSTLPLLPVPLEVIINTTVCGADVPCCNRGELNDTCRCRVSYGSSCQFCPAGYEAINSTAPCLGHFEIPLEPESDLYNPDWSPRSTFDQPTSHKHPHHSSRRMIGDDDSPNDGGWLRRTFYFKGLCYQRSTLEWIYYRSPEERDSGFEPSSLRFAASSMSHPSWAPPQPIVPRIIDGPIPSDVYWEDHHAMYAIYQGWHAANVAHVIWDEFMPLYYMMYLFDVVTHDIQPLRMNTPPGHGWWDTMCHTETGSRPKCRQFYASMTHLLTPSSRIVDMEAFFGKAGDRHVCFPRLLAGMGSMTDHCLDVTMHGRKPGPHVCNEGRAAMLWQYRNWLLEAAGGDPTLVPCRHNILVGSNSFKRHIDNWDEVAEAVRERLGLPVRRIDWAQLSIDEQLILASNTTLYLAMCGGSASPAMFMPRGGTMIIWCSDYKLDWNLYNHMSHLRVIYFPVRDVVDIQQALRATAEALTQWVPWSDAMVSCPFGSFARPGVWSDWGPCSEPCGGNRSRNCVIYDAGPSCSGPGIEACNTDCDNGTSSL